MLSKQSIERYRKNNNTDRLSVMERRTENLALDYDVIVVGAGPAGLSTAKTIGEKGLSCLVVEKSKEIGYPVRTSGASWVDEIKNLGIPETCFNPVHNISLIGPTKEANFAFKEAVACILDVTEVNRFLASQAKNNGVEIKLGTDAKNPLLSEGNVEGVEVISKNSIERLKCKVVVDASGLNATLLKKLGLLKYWERIGLGVQYDIESPNIDRDWLGLYMGNEFIPSGYGWFFPWKENRARVGLGIIRPDSYQNPLSYMDTFMNSNRLPNIKDCKIMGREVGVFPCAGPLQATVLNGFLAVGDAVGQGSPLHGEGIRYAIKFGTIAGSTISAAIQRGDVSKDSLQSYEQSWKGQEEKNFERALAIQRRISKYNDEQWDRGISYLEQIGKKDMQLIIQLFKTNLSVKNTWRVLKQSPISAIKYLASSI